MPCNNTSCTHVAFDVCAKYSLTFGEHTGFVSKGFVRLLNRTNSEHKRYANARYNIAIKILNVSFANFQVKVCIFQMAVPIKIDAITQSANQNEATGPQ